MLNGLYYVTFSSPIGGSGGGIVVVRDGFLDGGDHGYTYQGRLNIANGTASATLAVERHNPEAESIFGTTPAFTLQVLGAFEDGKGFSMNGYVVQNQGAKISIQGRYLRPLAI